MFEAFLGSCFLHKDSANDKWIFGPFWDLGHAFNGGHSKQKFMYEDTWFPASIIDEIAKFPHFQQKVREYWPHFYGDIYPSLDDYIDSYALHIAAAVTQNYRLWPQYGNEDEFVRAEKVKERLKQKVEFLQSKWGEQDMRIIGVDNHEEIAESVELFDLSGQKQSAKPIKPGIYILRTKTKSGEVKTRKVIY